MAKKKKRTRATEFRAIDRATIADRDSGCIFCNMNYFNEELNMYEKSNFQTMHYIPRSQGGLGIPQNGAVGCIGHHAMLDNGNKGRGPEMKELFKKYLQSKYPDWDESELVFNKYRL